MAVCYCTEQDKLDAFQQALTKRSLSVSLIEVEGTIVGLVCRFEKVKTTLEVYHVPKTKDLEIVRHEGIHVLHPIQFWRLQSAIVDALADVGATID